MAQKVRWKGEPDRRQKHPGIKLKTVAFKKVPLDKEFTYVEVRYRKFPTTRGTSGTFFNAQAIQKNVVPAEIWMDDEDQVQIIEVEYPAYNDYG